MPTRSDIDAVQDKLERLIVARYLSDDVPAGPSDAAEAVPWADLAADKRTFLLISKVTWPGYDVQQIVEVANRVLLGESPQHWMDGIVASDQAEANFAALREQQEEKFFQFNGRLPTNEDLDYDRQLHEAAERGRHLSRREKDRER